MHWPAKSSLTMYYRSSVTLNEEKFYQGLKVVVPYAFQAKFSNTFLDL